MPRIGAIVLCALGLVLARPVEAASVITAIVTNPLTGVAIDGYDAVSFFVGGEPQQGRPDYSYEWGGVPWYFTSAANRDVFAHNPEVYAPQWGGHCPASLSRGYLSDGKPQVYLVAGTRLYLFHSEANRDAFLASPLAMEQAAEINWARLKSGLNAGEPPVLPDTGP